jgi:translation elongation factor EF-Ts
LLTLINSLAVIQLSLNKWITDARDMGHDAASKNYYEMNARSLITIWGDSYHLTDYANRSWAGLTNQYYSVRWDRFINEVIKAEQVQKAVEAALKKAGINPAHVDSEDHMESNMAKGWITAEDVAKAKEIIATVSAEKAAHLPEQMIQNIAKGRLGKFLKEVCLLNQEDIMDGKKTVREVLKEADPELKIVDFKRFTLRAE